jgi:hypothetical protein
MRVEIDQANRSGQAEHFRVTTDQPSRLVAIYAVGCVDDAVVYRLPAPLGT